MKMRSAPIWILFALVAFGWGRTSQAEGPTRIAEGRSYASSVAYYASSASYASYYFALYTGPWFQAGEVIYYIRTENNYYIASDESGRAFAHDDVAQNLAYDDPKDKQATAGAYAAYRYAQIQYNYSAAIYLYYGALIEGHSYSDIAYPYELNVTAMYLGYYDLQQPLP